MTSSPRRRSVRATPVGRRAAWPLAASIVAALLEGAATAQATPAFDPHVALARGGRVAVERARRTLLRLPPAAQRPEVLLQALRSTDAARRSAAGAVLLRTGLEPAAVAAWLLEEHDPLVLAPLLDALPLERLEALVRQAPRFVDGEDLERQDAQDALRARGFARLVDAGRADGELWRLVVAGEDEALARFAAALAVEHVWPFPLPRFDELPPRARSRLLEELGVRPRRDAADAIDRILRDQTLGPAERFFALTARRSEEWTLADLQALVDAVLGEDRDARHAAEHASWLVSSSVAGRLVGEAHRRLLDGAEIAPMLELLRNVDAKSERHLVALARELDDVQRDAIVEWLALRQSAQLDVLVREALDGKYPLTPALLRRAPLGLDDDARRARVLAALARPTDEERAPLAGETEAQTTARREQRDALRVAAFDALCNAGIHHDDVLAFALENPDEQHGRLPIYLRIPFDRVPEAAWVRLLEGLVPRAAARVLGELVRPRADGGPTALPPRVLDLIARWAGEGGPLAAAATEVCLRAAPEPIARRVWAGLDAAARRSQALVLRHRADALALELLVAEPIDGEAFELRFARLALGDAAMLDGLLRAPAAWPKPWLRRLAELVPARLDAARVAAIAAGFAQLDEAVQPYVLQWLVARPDLDDAGLAERLYAATAGELESELRLVALRGVLARPAGREGVRARLDAALAKGLDDAGQDEAYELVGQSAAPLDAATTRFLARFVLVEPLMRPDAELGAALRLDALPHEPRVQLAYQRLVREEAMHVGEAFEAATAEALAHADFAMASAARLLRLLEVFAREPRTRAAAGPPLARAILALDDDDVRVRGPAHQMLAEAAEAAADFTGAARHWEAAARGYRDGSPAPLVRRAFLGESSQMDRLSPSAWLVARAPLARARAALAAGDRAAAREQLSIAVERGFGDSRTEAELAALQKELER